MALLLAAARPSCGSRGEQAPSLAPLTPPINLTRHRSAPPPGRSTAEVQLIKVVGCERTRGTTRVRMAAGGRALAALHGCLLREAAVTARLTCPPPEHASALDALQRDRRELARANKALQEELAALVAAQLAAAAADGGVVVYHRQGGGGDLPFLQLVASAALEASPQLLLLLTADSAPAADAGAGGGKGAAGKKGAAEGGAAAAPVAAGGELVFLLAGPAGVVKQAGPEVAALLGGRGGGRPGRFQGKAASLERVGAAAQACRQALAAAAG